MIGNRLSITQIDYHCLLVNESVQTQASHSMRDLRLMLSTYLFHCMLNRDPHAF